MKKSKSIFLIIFGLIMLMASKFGVVQALPTYQLYEDSSGVRWQYAYIEDSDRVEVSFFDNRNSKDSVTIPSLASLRSSDSTLPTAATKLVVVNYANQGLETPTSQTKNITTINLSNANVINGVAPMVQDDVVTTITFSSAVGTSIGTEAFMGYKLTINNLDKVTSIGDRAFKNAELTYKNLNLGNLTTIGDGAFQGTNIEKVTMINTERIEYNAFRDCVNLISVKLGDNVKDIGDVAFQNAQKLTEINYNNVTKVGNYAFADCTSYNVDISNTKLTDIGDAAYSNTTGFTKSIKIPDGVTFLGWRVFYKSGITGVDLNNVEYLNSSKQKNMGAFYDGRQGEAFAECVNLNQVIFGKIWMIPYKTFYNDKKITKADLPDTVLWIGTEAFENCGINELDLNKVQRIDSSAFASNKLTELYLPKSINYLIGAGGAFRNNEITKVTVAYDTFVDGITRPGFNQTSGLLLDLFSGGAGAENPMSGAYPDSLTDLVIEAPYKDNEDVEISKLFGVKRLPISELSLFNNGYFNHKEDLSGYKNIIGNYYFSGLFKLKSITIGEGYEFIGDGAFLPYNTGRQFYQNGESQKLILLENLKLPISLKGIGRSAFEFAIQKNIEIELPENIEYIDNKAFLYSYGFFGDVNLKKLKFLGADSFNHSGVKDIYLYDKLEYLGIRAFNCNPGTLDYSDELLPPKTNTRKIIVDMDFYGLQKDGFLYNFSNIDYFDMTKSDGYDLIKFTDKALTEPGRADMYRIKAKEIDLSETPWKTIPMSMFASAHIERIKLPKNLEKIEGCDGIGGIYCGAFAGAVVKEPIEIPNSVKYIEGHAFNGLSSYTHDNCHPDKSTNSIPIKNLPKNLEKVGMGAFYNVTFAEEVTIPESLVSISSYPRTFGAVPEANVVQESIIIEADLLKALGNIENTSTIADLFGGDEN